MDSIQYPYYSRKNSISNKLYRHLHKTKLNNCKTVNIYRQIWWCVSFRGRPESRDYLNSLFCKARKFLWNLTTWNLLIWILLGFRICDNELYFYEIVKFWNFKLSILLFIFCEHFSSRTPDNLNSWKYLKTTGIIMNEYWYYERRFIYER